jgi:hypothetical protein
MCASSNALDALARERDEEIDRLRAEVERLRDALRLLRSHTEGCCNRDVAQQVDAVLRGEGER